MAKERSTLGPSKWADRHTKGLPLTLVSKPRDSQDPSKATEDVDNGTPPRDIPALESPQFPTTTSSSPTTAVDPTVPDEAPTSSASPSLPLPHPSS
ncbi:hypothetical protein Acr_02g0000920 [Actinidia rufa]|uniref:Uncharacterized protein n=1 Tax=Actinidia rufa TaxID=165716 RepID=A0A7J0E6F1_9ERIC|nr:hypothetical protein Acr_02g0000920 [Actinidia rufa]